MSRVLGWLRWLRAWWFDMQTLYAHVAHLKHELAEARKAYADLEAAGRRELSIVVALHDLGVRNLRSTIAGLDAECVSWQSQLAAAQQEVRDERARSNAAWQRLGHVGMLADHEDMPPHLAALVRDHTARIQSTGVPTHV